MLARVLASAALSLAVCLAVGNEACAAECGDVTGNSDGIKTSDALAVLRKSVGQPVNLQCTASESQYSRVRGFGLEGLGCSSTKFKASTGETLTASQGQYSSYIDFPHDSIDWVEATACGETIRYNGPFTVPRERMLRVEVLLLDPIWEGYTCDDIITYITLIDEGPRPGGNP